MDIRPIRTDEDQRAALAEIDGCWGAPDGTEEGDKLNVLSSSPPVALGAHRLDLFFAVAGFDGNQKDRLVLVYLACLSSQFRKPCGVPMSSVIILRARPKIDMPPASEPPTPSASAALTALAAEHFDRSANLPDKPAVVPQLRPLS